ncbi:Gfo/Idh/MocA family protein [Nocardia rhamnosiphila]|uniref:Gfo/Idh/MocA family oxidoreductase n=1 Tax=Nocardia rhamnosiphila TaxID=426716 RepID=A0ABV2WXQ2_9NOCA
MTERDVVISGYGVAGELHAHLFAARPDARIVGVADPSQFRRAAAEDRFPGITTASTLHDLTVHTDIVVIATPPLFHDGDCWTAITRHHAHVLCEKPAIVDPVGGRHLGSIASEQQLVIWPVHNYLYAPAVRTMRNLLKSGAIGDIRQAYIDIERIAPSAAHTAWRRSTAEGGGILNDHGPHPLYLLSYFLGHNADAVSCRTDRGDHGVEQSARLGLKYSTTTADISLNWKSGARQSRYRFYGSKGQLTWERDKLTVITLSNTSAFCVDDLSAPGHTHASWTRSLHAEFLNLVDSGRQSRHWWHAVNVAAVLRAARVSECAGGRWADVAMLPE